MTKRSDALSTLLDALFNTSMLMKDIPGWQAESDILLDMMNKARREYGGTQTATVYNIPRK